MSNNTYPCNISGEACVLRSGYFLYSRKMLNILWTLTVFIWLTWSTSVSLSLLSCECCRGVYTRDLECRLGQGHRRFEVVISSMLGGTWCCRSWPIDWRRWIRSRSKSGREALFVSTMHCCTESVMSYHHFLFVNYTVHQFFLLGSADTFCKKWQNLCKFAPTRPM